MNRKDCWLLVILAVGALWLNACQPNLIVPQTGKQEQPTQAHTETPAPAVDEVTQDDAPQQSVTVLGHEQARDMVVHLLVEQYTLEAPSGWTVQDDTPEGLLGMAAFTFTSGAWVVRVEAPVVAPENAIYTVQVDQVAAGLHWQGKVAADGSVEERQVVEPASTLSFDAARDAAMNYLCATHGLTPAGEWTEQGVTHPSPGEITITYTSQAWVAQISAQASAPLVSEYQVVIDNLSEMARWEGMVTLNGEVTERAFTRAESPDSSVATDDSAVVEGWIGVVVSNPPGAQYDDYFQLLDQDGSRYGIDAQEDNVRAQIKAYRDTGTLIQVWGRLERNAMDAYETRIVVERLAEYNE